MASTGFIIMFATDSDRPVDHFWDGANQIEIASGQTPDGAQFFVNKSEARIEAGRLQQLYPNQEVAVVTANLAITPTFDTTPEVTAPTAPRSAT